MNDNESAIINNDSALPIPRQFARWLGWNEAGILQQLHWHTQEGHGQIVEGIRWIRMSETEWMEEIPLDEKAIQRAIKNLVGDGLIKSAVFAGRCRWYSVDYEAVKALAGPVERITHKSDVRKQARSQRQDAKVQIVPIAITPIPQASCEPAEDKSDSYANVKEQNVPIDLKEQNGANLNGYKMSFAKEQFVPLQESLQESKESLLLSAHAREDLDRIGDLCKTNFFNPRIEPYKTSLIEAINKYTTSRVLWAIELALSPEKANGQPKTWGFVLGILEKDKDGTYQAQQPRNGANQNGNPILQRRETETNGNGPTAAEVAAAFKFATSRGRQRT